MTADTITFAVQLGSDGFAVARAVAERLNYRYLDWEITSRAATEAGVSPEVVAASEQNRSTLQRIVQGLMTSSSVMGDETGVMADPPPPAMSAAIAQLNTGSYRYFVEDVVREVAERGEAVIVGHAAQVVLRGNPHVLRVLVVGSFRNRTERLAADSGISIEKARDEILKSDKERLGFFKRAYGVNLLDPQLYDLTINTDELSVDKIAAAVVSLAQSVQGMMPEVIVPEPAPSAEPVKLPDEVPQTRQRDALAAAGEALKRATEVSPGNPAAWAQDVIAALTVLRRVFERHVKESEADGGSLAEAVQIKPHLARRVDQIRQDHVRMLQEIDDFIAELKAQIEIGEIGVEALKDRIVRLEVSLRLHESRGADLLHEAYMRDEGGEGH